MSKKTNTNPRTEPIVTINGLRYGLLPDQDELITQEQVAAIFGVKPVRICELHRFNYLQPVSKAGRNLLYNKNDVDKLKSNGRIKHWVKALNQ